MRQSYGAKIWTLANTFQFIWWGLDTWMTGVGAVGGSVYLDLGPMEFRVYYG